MTLRNAAGALFLFAAIAGAPRAAQNYADVEGADFLRETQSIFVGKLIDKHSYYSPDKRFIFTRHLFEVLDTIKGKAASRTEVIEYGGTVGTETMAVSHGPVYIVGREYLVFSYLDLLKHNRTFGGSLGQLQVVRDRDGRSFVRTYPSHPLYHILDRAQVGTFHDLRAVSSQLRKAIKEVLREKK